jgi:hypothetical protein
MRLTECFDRIKRAKEDYRTASRAIQALTTLAAQQPDVLHGQGLDPAGIRALDLDHLHSVYFIWMFACFESSLRHFRQAESKSKSRTKPKSKRKSKTKAVDLIIAIGTRRAIPQDTLDTVQEIREFRNDLIHEQHGDVRPFTIDEASRHLNIYLSRLPLEW